MASMFFWFLILLCFFTLLPLKSFGFICPGPIYLRHGFSYARIESNISGRASQEYAKIRMKLVYFPSVVDKPYKGLVQEAADFWTKVLSVKPVDDRIFKSQDCESENRTIYKALDGSIKKEKYCLGSCNVTTKCFEIEIPEEHLDGCKSCTEKGENCSKNEAEIGTGVKNADLVFYVTAVDTTACINSAGLLAYAGPCEVEPNLDRPVFAMINICPTRAVSHSDDKKSMLRLIKHEMMHALGFGFDTFKLFRNKHGQPLWPRDEKGEPRELKNFHPSAQRVLSQIRRDWHVRGKVIKSERLFLTTPSVVREARNHFGCPDLEGAELEDFGPVGTKDNHFEARVFYDEGMKGNSATGKQLFSRLSFAVLEDSGWYQVDYSLAEDMELGRNLGCDFSKKSCKFWMDTKRKERESTEPYCDSPDFSNQQSFICNGTKKLFSGCPLKKFSQDYLKKLHNVDAFENATQLPLKYQNFDNISGVSEEEVPALGSFDRLADFCPVPLQDFDIRILHDVADKIDCNEEAKSGDEPKPAEEGNPVEEAKDAEHQETNQTSSIDSSVPLILLFTLILIFS